MADWDPEAFTRGLLADLRANAGRATSGPMAGRALLILTTTGARTGEPRTAILAYTRDGQAYVVAGSKSGAPTHPAWYTNLVANPSFEAGASSAPVLQSGRSPSRAGRNRRLESKTEIGRLLGAHSCTACKHTNRLTPATASRRGSCRAHWAWR